MGFGYLFVGFLIAYVTSLAGGFPAYLIGFLLILAAVGKLRLYKRTYTLALLPLIPLILISAFEIICTVMGLVSFGGIYPEGILGTAINAAFAVLNFVLWELLLLATAKLYGEVGLPKLRLRSVQNMVAYGIYFVLAVLQLTGLFDDVPGFDAALLILYLLVVVFGLVLLASCYRRICPEGEEDAPRRKSRFGFINRFYDELDKRESNAASESARQYYERKHRGKK